MLATLGKPQNFNDNFQIAEKMSKLSTAEEVNTSILHVLKTTPPPKTYGKEARSLFMLDEEYTNLNHGKLILYVEITLCD